MAAKRPDRNAIEHLSGELEHQLRARHSRSTPVHDFTNYLLAELAQMPLDTHNGKPSLNGGDWYSHTRGPLSY